MNYSTPGNYRAMATLLVLRESGWPLRWRNCNFHGILGHNVAVICTEECKSRYSGARGLSDVYTAPDWGGILISPQRRGNPELCKWPCIHISTLWMPLSAELAAQRDMWIAKDLRRLDYEMLRD